MDRTFGAGAENRRRSSRGLILETLEPRTLLDARSFRTASLTATEAELVAQSLHVIARFPDHNVGHQHKDSIAIRVGNKAFRLPSRQIILGFKAQGTGSQPLTPGLIRIVPDGGARVLGTIYAQQGSNSAVSLTVARLTAGTFSVQVGDKPGRRVPTGLTRFSLAMSTAISGSILTICTRSVPCSARRPVTHVTLPVPMSTATARLDRGTGSSHGETWGRELRFDH